MTKSPYEIRLDVLQLAKDMIDKNNDIAISNNEIEIAKINSGIYNSPRSEIPQITSCSTTEIIARASELYAFVNNKTIT